MQAASEDARKKLAEVGLPGSLEAHESQGGISDAVWRKVESTQGYTGGVTGANTCLSGAVIA